MRQRPSVKSPVEARLSASRRTRRPVFSSLACSKFFCASDWIVRRFFSCVWTPGSASLASWRVCSRLVLDAVAISSYLGKGDAFDRSLEDFSGRYADQNDRDFKAFVGAVRSGRLEAIEGV